ncbi:hypothetical protein E4U55_004679 [Claviceps digitariae]|nr:hypothetical protein E4U55_004679 [Claviceps digitariae]
MRFLGSFFLLAAAVCSAGVLPQPIPVDSQPAPALENLGPRAAAEAGGMDMELYRRQKWLGCLTSFPLLRVTHDGRTRIQSAINNRADRTYTSPDGGLDVRILAQHVRSDRFIGVEITNHALFGGHIILSNYRDTFSDTVARETIRIEYNGITTRTCVRLPRLDGTWYFARDADPRFPPPRS